MARPTEWTKPERQKATDLICSKIALGESVRRILSNKNEDINLPSRKTFYEWLSEDSALCDQYAQFMLIRSDDMADDMLNIADSVDDDLITLDDGREVVNNNVIQRDRLRVDTRKWLLSKMQPKKYGDRVDSDITTNGKDITQPARFLTPTEMKAFLTKLDEDC